MCLTAAAVNLLLIQQIFRFTKFCCSHKHDSVLDDGSALSLFVFWILADYSDTSFSFDDLTFLADRFYRSSYFHLNPPFFPFFWPAGHEGIPRGLFSLPAKWPSRYPTVGPTAAQQLDCTAINRCFRPFLRTKIECHTKGRFIV